MGATADRGTDVPGIDSAKVDALDSVELSWRYKSLPAAAHGQTAAQYASSGATLASLQTPVLTLDAHSMAGNVETMARWCAGHGVLLAPHGKTTMAPQMWRDQLEHGAWGITLANASQLRVGHAFGVRRIMLANSLTDPQAVAWLAEHQGPGFQVVSWIDSAQTVALQGTVLAAHPGAVLDVIVELGGGGGRTGARTVAEAAEVARAVAAEPGLRLVGVGGYEGSLAHSADDGALTTVRGYLRALRELHEQLLAEKLYAPGAGIIITAGGSAYFDDVVQELAGCITAGTEGGPRVDVMLRSGAYMVHDDGFYRGISPFARAAEVPGGPRQFASAMHAWARVVSTPEPGLAILDAGKRDMPVDEGMPEPQQIGRSLGGDMAVLEDAAITAVNDQHCYLRFNPETTAVNIGDVVRLGLSHPCTAFDKWTLIPVLARTGTDNRVVGLIHTFF